MPLRQSIGEEAWNRRTIHDYAQRLRAFFLFAEARGWCRAGLAAGIMAPRFMADETVPKGIRREDVLRLLASVGGDRPVDKRDRAILMLFSLTGCGPGKSSACGSTIWTGKRDHSRSLPKARTDPWLATSPDVGHAILRYIGKPARRFRAQPLLHIERSHPNRSAERPSARSSGSSRRHRHRHGRRGTHACGIQRPSIFWIRACR